MGDAVTRDEFIADYRRHWAAKGHPPLASDEEVGKYWDEKFAPFLVPDWAPSGAVPDGSRKMIAEVEIAYLGSDHGWSYPTILRWREVK